jgi:putative NIF3 family GTP cyclohydrolase 1 type 2
MYSYPEELADRSWDNVGLLLGNSESDSKKRKPVVLVTNDLTFQVAVDAIGQGASVIVSYREFTRMKTRKSWEETATIRT